MKTHIRVTKIIPVAVALLLLWTSQQAFAIYYQGTVSKGSVFSWVASTPATNPGSVAVTVTIIDSNGKETVPTVATLRPLVTIIFNLPIPRDAKRIIIQLDLPLGSSSVTTNINGTVRTLTGDTRIVLDVI